METGKTIRFIHSPARNTQTAYPDEEYEYASSAAEAETDAESAEWSGAEVRSRQSIAPMALIGLASAAFLFVALIFGQISLMNVSDKSLELEETLKELKEENAKLQITYESTFNYDEIEEYAKSELGMRKPSSDQIFYIDTVSQDKAVVVSENAAEASLLDRFSDALNALRSYFSDAAAYT